MTPPDKNHLPLIGISACLAGQRVRYDGQDKFNTLVAELIAPYCRLLPFCPEAVAGMGIPRPPINLIQSTNGIRAMGRDTPHTDVTARLQTVGLAVTRSQPDLSGFILQSRSPSCGVNTTPVYDSTQQQVVNTRGTGLFAEQLQRGFPGLPIISDCDLSPTAIQLFLQQVNLYHQKLMNAAADAP